MTPFIRFTSWIVAIGNGGATANAWRAIEERAQAEAALDALSARMNGDAPSSDARSSNAWSSNTPSNNASSSNAAPSRAA